MVPLYGCIVFGLKLFGKNFNSCQSIITISILSSPEKGCGLTLKRTEIPFAWNKFGLVILERKVKMFLKKM